MQSYSNFTVACAVSVNAHGRYVGHGPIANRCGRCSWCWRWRVVEADRKQNTELLRARIGGYGAIGVITEVELDLDDNTKMERRIEVGPARRLPGVLRRPGAE